MEVFITRTSSFLPNKAISNDEMESYLGLINGKLSKSKAIVLRNNGIKQRYYALNEKGEPTHTNAQLVSKAVRKLFGNDSKKIEDIELLSCGTTTPDQLLPSHAVMVHGLLNEMGNVEVTSNSGACCSGMHSLKYAFMSIKSGEKQNAVCAGSERTSSVLKSDSFEEEGKYIEVLQEDPYVAFEKDFLRWMLSDGAGAFYLENKKKDNGLSLKVEWIELSSYANVFETCMYMGAVKQPDGSLKSFHNVSQKELLSDSVLSLKQDVKLLSAQIVTQGFHSMKSMLSKHGIKTESIDYFLPHMSSFFFKDKIYDFLKDNGMHIPYVKWYTNLQDKGNVGAGSIYIMLDDLFKSGKLKEGQKILLAVPESARFSYAFCLLTVC